MKPNQWLGKIVANNGAVKSPFIRCQYPWQWKMFAHNDRRRLTVGEGLELIRAMRASLLDVETPSPEDWSLLEKLQEFEEDSLAGKLSE